MAINCSTGWAGVRIQGCKPQNQGGLMSLSGICIAPLSSSTVITQSSSDETITAITGINFYCFDLPKGVCYFTCKPSGDDENGTLFYEGEISLVINKLTAAVRNQIKILALSRVHIICKDANGNHWLCGLQNGCDLGSDSEMGSGDKPNSRNGAVLKFKFFELDPMVYVTSNNVFSSTY